MKKLFKNLGKVVLAGTIGLTALGFGTESASAVDIRAYKSTDLTYERTADGVLTYTKQWGLLVTDKDAKSGIVDVNYDVKPSSNQLRCVYNSFTDVVNDTPKATPEVGKLIEAKKLTTTSASQCRQVSHGEKSFYAFSSHLGKFFQPNEQGKAVTLIAGHKATIYVNIKPRFTDVPIHNSYWDEIEYLAKQGIVEGKGNGKFDPTGTLTKGQVAKMVAVGIKLDKKYPANYKFSHKFSDLDSTHWAYRYIMMATEEGIFDKTSTFGVNNAFTRGEMAVVLTRSFDIKGSKVSPKNFSDVTTSSVGSEMYNAINKLSAYSIAQGGTDGKFNPNGKLSRQHFAVFMARTMVEGEGFRYIYVK